MFSLLFTGSRNSSRGSALEYFVFYGIIFFLMDLYFRLFFSLLVYHHIEGFMACLDA